MIRYSIPGVRRDRIITPIFIVRWFRAVKRSIMRFFRWIIKSFEYSVFLWNDVDYDWAHILLVLKYKLSRARKHILNHNIIEDAKLISIDIKRAEDLIERIIADKYCDKELTEYYNKYGYCWKSQKTAQEMEELEIIVNKMDSLLQADRDELFKLLREKLWEWWD